MFKSIKNVISESESAALSLSNVDDDTSDIDDAIANDMSNDKPKKSKENKSVNLIRSLSSNIKDKLQKKKFHRLEIDDKASDSMEDDMHMMDNENDTMNNNYNEQQSLNENIDDIDDDLDDEHSNSYSDIHTQENIEFTQNIHHSLHDDEEDENYHSQLSIEDDGNHSQSPHKQINANTFENSYTFCVALKSILCHLLTLIFVSFTQIMVSSALYIIVPLHVAMTLHGGELLTGLIFLNYGFAYVVFNIFGHLCSRYYGSIFTILLSIFVSSVSLLFMTIFTDYFVWLMMMFCQGISFALFTVGSHSFILDNISIKLHTNVQHLIHFFNLIAIICGCIFAGNVISNNSIIIAVGITIGFSLFGVLFLCVFSIPPKYNNNSLVNNDNNNEDRIITKASLSAWKSSYKQLSLQQHLSIFSWIKTKDNENSRNNEMNGDNNTPIYELDDKLNTFQVFDKHMKTLFSIMIFSFGLTFARCVRLLILTFKCLDISVAHALTAHDIGYINGISYVPELFLYLLSYKILYRFGRKYTMIATYLLFVICLFVLPYCENKRSITYIAILFGIANGLSYDLIHKVALDIAPTEYRDKFFTIYQTLTNVAYIIAPIFITLLIEISHLEIACICSAVIIILSLIWSLCVMTDPNTTGKRYQHIDLDKSYAINNENYNDEISLNLNGLINGKHIGPPINKHKIKMELHSIDSVMELDQSVAANDTNAETIIQNVKQQTEYNDTTEITIFQQLFGNKNEQEEKEKEKEQQDDDVDIVNDDTYVNRIANKAIGDIRLGQNQNENENENQYKFEIGHFDEEEEEESIMYQLSSTD